MTFLNALKILAAVGTLAAGVISIVSPPSAERFTGLTAAGPRGTSEIRAVLGGLFVGLGIAVLIFRSAHAFRTLGIGYLAIALVRAASIAGDRAPTRSNWISLVSEVVLGVLLVL
ncbi:MAG: DUF4345 family protein [Candidatus Bipolaricaulota bacterium]